jgi:hypothetical protein
VDEVGFNVSMRRKFGRYLQGTTSITTVPAIKSRNISICCAMSKSGVLFKKISLLPFNGYSFLGYIDDFFAFLNNLNLKNCLVIMDNVLFHKKSEVVLKFG